MASAARNPHTGAEPGGSAQDPVLKEIVRRLVAALKPERIYLFGSRARGNADKESDYDILVVVPPSDVPGYKRRRIAYRALDGLGISKDVVVLTNDEFERRSRVVTSMPAAVIREGTELYAP